MTDIKELKVAYASTKSIDGPDVWQIHKWIGQVRVIFSFILIIIMIMIILLKKHFKLSNSGKRKAEVETKCYNTLIYFHYTFFYNYMVNPRVYLVILRK